MRSVVVTRYHPLLVMLHWLLAILIVGLWCVGFFLLTAMSNTDPHKIGILLIHMAVGMLVFGLMLIRLIVRLSMAKPADATTGHPALDRLVPLVHYGFYAVVLLLPATGLATSVLAGLNRSVFQHSGEPLPPTFDTYPSFVAHAYLAWLLAAMVVLHVVAALSHQFLLRDGLLRRIWFGRRNPDLATRTK